MSVFFGAPTCCIRVVADVSERFLVLPVAALVLSPMSVFFDAASCCTSVDVDRGVDVDAADRYY